MTSGRLAGKVGIVTGASRGIGLATAIAAVREGATVIAAARTTADLDAAAGDATSLAGRFLPHALDVRDEQAIQAVVERATGELGKLDFLVNNAGISKSGRLPDVTADDWDEIQRVNVLAPMLACKHAIGAMLSTGTAGSVVNVGSTLSVQGTGSSTLYATTKHALLGLTRAIAVDPAHAAAGIRVNCVCPGSVRTDLATRHFVSAEDPEAALQQFADWYPSKRFGDPDEIADIVVFLVSDESTLINGSAIMADSGLHARGYQTRERRND